MSGAIARPRRGTALPPASAPRLRYCLAIPGAALLLYATLAALWHWGPHRLYFGVLQLFAFGPFRFPFLDAHAVLAAVQCWRYGIDVYQSNPCDVLGRPHVYSPLWLRITPSFLNVDATVAVGLGLGLLFIGSLAAVCRPHTRGETLVLAFTALSPVTVYALERANADIAIFLLILAGCMLGRAPRPWRLGAYALYFFAGLLKYYPLVLLALIVRERRREAITVGAIAGCVLLLLVAGDRSEVAKALANIPHSSYFTDSFSALNLPFGLAELSVGVPFRGFAAAVLIATLVGLAGARARRLLSLLDRASFDFSGVETQCLIAGALVLIGCFFAAQNADYRGIFFVLAMPGLLQLRRSTTDTELRRFLARMCATTLFVVWEPLWRASVIAAVAALPSALRPRVENLFWLGRELVWWWLIAGLVAIVLCHMRRLPLIMDTRTALPNR